MKTMIQTEVMTFDELSDKAKEKARAWWVEGSFNDDWYQSAYDDAETIGLKLTSFDMCSASFVRGLQGEFIKDPVDVATAIMAGHGITCDTYKSAKAYALNVAAAKVDMEELNAQFLAQLLCDYTKLLQQEYEYRYSNECVDQNIIANEYTFTAEGKRFG